MFYNFRCWMFPVCSIFSFLLCVQYLTVSFIYIQDIIVLTFFMITIAVSTYNTIDSYFTTRCDVTFLTWSTMTKLNGSIDELSRLASSRYIWTVRIAWVRYRDCHTDSNCMLVYLLSLLRIWVPVINSLAIQFSTKLFTIPSSSRGKLQDFKVVQMPITC